MFDNICDHPDRMLRKRIKWMLFIIASFNWLSMQVCIAQDKGCSYLDKVKPAVFLSLVKQEQDTGQIFLRLTNNSTCALQVETNDYTVTSEYQKYSKEKARKRQPDGTTIVSYTFDPPNGTRIPVFYDVRLGKDSADTPANYWNGRDLIFFHTLAPGRTIIFPIKGDHFRNRYDISVLFHYEWENNKELSTLGTITHRVRYIYELEDGYYKPK